MSKRRVNIHSIARKAGVTPTTVSRALNDKPDINPATKARILAIAQQLGYVPSTIARSLATQRTHTIGLAVRTISDMWVAEIVPAIEEVLRAAGYEVFLSTHYANPERERNIIETYRGRQVDGVIVISPLLREAYQELQAKWQLSIVLISPLLDTVHRYVVTSDDWRGTELAIRHLVTLGHRRIAYIGVPKWVIRAQDRLKSYRRTLEEYGIPFDPALVFLGDAHEEGGEAGLEALMALETPPTAIFCFNDLTALGALMRAKAMGLRVPHDLSLIGFDDIPLARYLDPPLTTVRQDMDGLGRQAAHMLLNLIAGRETGAPVVLPTQLIERGSTAPPRLEK